MQKKIKSITTTASTDGKKGIRFMQVCNCGLECPIHHTSNSEIIICAAIKDSNNRIFRGHRHHDAIHAMSTRPGNARVVEEGFITSSNRFVGRKEAMEVQIKAGKMPYSEKGIDLFSEDLY